jgi:hypothetical protein
LSPNGAQAGRTASYGVRHFNELGGALKALLLWKKRKGNRKIIGKRNNNLGFS